MKKKNNKSFPLTFFLSKSRKGWIEIVEAVVSILLVTVALLVVINKGYVGKSDISEGVYKTELSILREIETNSSFRKDILDFSGDLPIESIDADFPSELKDKINERTPAHLECIGKICNLCSSGVCEGGESPLPCNMEREMETDVYSQTVLISSIVDSLGTGGASPTALYRRLSLFCWAK